MPKLAFMEQPPLQLLKQAETIIQQLKPLYNANRLAFDMQCSMYLSGRQNTVLRQSVIYSIHHTMPSAAKSTLSDVSTALSGYFMQAALF